MADHVVVCERVIALAERAFDLDGFVFGPHTDLVSIAMQTDPEALEGLLAMLEREFDIQAPQILSESGKVRRAQLFVDEALTVSQLAEIVATGSWPERWTRSGKTMLPLFYP